MIYFSEILKAKIINPKKEISGRVTDILIKAESEIETPEIIGLVVKDKTPNKKFLAQRYVAEWQPKKILINQTFDNITEKIPSGTNIVSLNNAVLDKQIVDLSGLRVVRVNDLQFGRIQQTMRLIAIDISTRGLLRRLGIKGRRIDLIFKPHFLAWKNIHSLADKLQLATGVKEMIKLHPADIANIIEKMNINQATVWLQSLDQNKAARVLEEIQPDIKKILVKSLGSERAAVLATRMSVDELVDLIQLLPFDQSQEIIKKLPQNNKTKNIKKILNYDEDTAGGLMTTEFITGRPESRVSEIIDEIKKLSPTYHSINYIYITDQAEKFLGVISIRTLIIAEKDQMLKNVMKSREKLPIVTVNKSIGFLASLMTKYNLLAVAVVDKDKKILGVVTVDDIMRRLIPDA
jgi:CBS domain-containing protein